MARLWVLLPFALVSLVGAQISCRDRNGQPVDWYYMYKLPELKDHPNHQVQEGRAYLYMDVNSKKWSLSEHSIQENDGHPAAYTINQIYEKKNSYYLMYNDEIPPDGHGSYYRGHCKGVQLFDMETGFWLIHSVPKFPGNQSYDYPDSGRYYGQSFLCVTFSTKDNLAEIAEQLYYMTPDIYAKNLPKEMAQLYPNLVDVLNGENRSKAPYNRQVTLTSKDGQEFIHFGKHRKFFADLYANFVATSLHQSLYVETWQNGRGDLPAICNQTDRVFTLHTLQMDGVPFTTNKDHSKWCVGTHDSEPWICVGDTNRQISQFHRAGGTLCMKDRSVWQEYEQESVTYYDCDGKVAKVPHLIDNHLNEH